jgi:hypothetical protein
VLVGVSERPASTSSSVLRDGLGVGSSAGAAVAHSGSINNAGFGNVLYVEPSDVYLWLHERTVFLNVQEETDPSSYREQYGTSSARRNVHTSAYDQSMIGCTRSNAGQPGSHGFRCESLAAQRT